jgi:type VI secretion system protein ImpI
MEEEKQFISFIVTNVRALEIGLSVKMSFGESGGTIGSNVDAGWYLKDENDSIDPLHCEICFIDDSFCVKDLSGKTFVNSSSMPLGVNSYARLDDENEIQIGNYELRAFLNREVELKDGANSLEQLFSNSNLDLLDAISTLSDDFDFSEENAENKEDNNSNLDPLLALELDSEQEYEIKEESLLSDETDKTELDEVQQELLNHINQNEADKQLDFVMQADSEDDISSAIKLGKFKNGELSDRYKKADTKEAILLTSSINKSEENNKTRKIGSYPMDDNILDLLEKEVGKNYTNENITSTSTIIEEDMTVSNNHVLGGPMINGLGVDIASNSSIEDMQKLSSEVGMTLKACVQGLLELHTQVKDSRYGVMHRSLQPIEDNPLRLGMSYQDTIRVMFDEEKSIVHLSAAASVEESMSMIKIHNEAVQYATNSALEEILQALSPAALLKRFNRYSRNSSLNSDNNEHSWAWKMYENYYQELTSNRQKGFEKLFWEMFEQYYDKKVREKHAE